MATYTRRHICIYIYIHRAIAIAMCTYMATYTYTYTQSRSHRHSHRHSHRLSHAATDIARHHLTTRESGAPETEGLRVREHQAEAKLRQRAGDVHHQAGPVYGKGTTVSRPRTKHCVPEDINLYIDICIDLYIYIYVYIYICGNTNKAICGHR